MSAAADLDALARRYLDLWERQVSDALSEPADAALLERWLNIVAQAGAAGAQGMQAMATSGPEGDDEAQGEERGAAGVGRRDGEGTDG